MSGRTTTMGRLLVGFTLWGNLLTLGAGNARANLEQLLAERKQLLQRTLRMTELMAEAGRASRGEVHEARIASLGAELDTKTTPDARAQIHRKLISEYEDYCKHVEHEAGVGRAPPPRRQEGSSCGSQGQDPS